MQTGEQQYLALCQRIIDEGVWVENERTGEQCLTVINADFEYDVSGGGFPLLTTRYVPWKGALAEMLGYLRGYSSAADFRAIGCVTWNKNANENEQWLANKYRKGEDDMGRCYGVQGRAWRNPEGVEIDQYKNIIDLLKTGVDNRRLIMTFHNPGELDRACLDACMHTHTFSVLGGTLYLTSSQRSVDVPLGLVSNQAQCAFLLAVTAQITGLKPGKVFHKLINCHIYENQLDQMRDIQLHREPTEQPTFSLDPRLKTLEDLETWFDVREHVKVEGYNPHGKIVYPFSV